MFTSAFEKKYEKAVNVIIISKGNIFGHVRCPIVGIVGQQYTIRTVTFCGGIVAALGACLCHVAPNILWLTIFWGGIHGLGFAFANTLFQVVVNQYFVKHRATASGLALSGACLGSMAFPFMIESILETYSLKGGFLILGGIVMNVLPPSLLLRSPRWLKGREQDNTTSPINAVAFEESKPEVFEDTENFSKHRSVTLSNNPLEEVSRSYRVRSLSGCGSQLKLDVQAVNAGNRQVLTTVSTVTGPTAQCIKNAALEESDVGSAKNDLDVNGTYVAAGPSSMESSDVKKSQGKKRGFKAALKSIIQLYKNPAYVLISIGMSTYIIVFIPILTVIVDYSKDKGLTQSDGKFLINAMAVGDLIGRLGFGWVTDKGYMTIPNFFTLTLFFQALFVALFPVANTFVSFMLMLGLYGVTAGSMLILFPVLVLEYVSGDQQTVAMGCVGFFSGLITFAVPPLIGHFRDRDGSYDGMFFFIGGVSFASGILWFVEPTIERWLVRKRKPIPSTEIALNQRY